MIDIEDFKDDINEGDIVTLKLIDQTQVTGKIIKIRATNVKIELNNNAANVAVFSFDDVNSYSTGSYDLLHSGHAIQPLARQAPSRVMSELHANQQVTDPVATTPSPSDKDIKSKLKSHLNIFEERLQLASIPGEIEPEFKFKAPNLTYETEKTVQRIFSEANNRFNSAVKTKEMSRLTTLATRLEVSLETFPGIAQLHALLGAIRWKLDDKAKASAPLMTAAVLSTMPEDWKNLAIAVADNSEYAFVALHKFFTSGSQFDKTLWFFLLRCARGASFYGTAINLIKHLTDRTQDEATLHLLASSLVFLLHSSRSEEAALNFVNMLDDESVLRQKFTAALSDFVAGGKHITESEKTRIKDIEFEIEDTAKKRSTLQPAEILENKTNPDLDPDIATRTKKGKVISYEVTSEGDKGMIRDLSSGEKFFFWGSHAADGLKAKFRQKDFDTEVIFSLFRNNRNSLQAHKLQPASQQGTDYSREGEFELNKRAISALQRGDREKAIEICKYGTTKYHDSTKLWLILAQQLSAMERVKEAADAYNHLIKIETRENARKSARTLYVQLLAKMGNNDTAEKETLNLIKDYPQDEYLKRLLNKIRQPEIMEGKDDSYVSAGLGDISPFLKKELEDAQFLDSSITDKGGHPEPEDAARLKEEAQNNTASNETFFTSLQAAKAFSQLPVGSYRQEDYTDCLALYAMNKGQWLVALMRGIAASPQKDVDSVKRLQILGDSAVSYFIEALTWLSQDMTQKFGGNIIKAYLQSVLLKHFSTNPQTTEKNLLSYGFSDMFSRILGDDPELFKIACEAFLTWGSYREVWARINQIPNSIRPLTMKMQTYQFKMRIKAELERATGANIDENIPREIFNTAFERRRAERDHLHRKFNEAAYCEMPVNFSYFQALLSKLKEFPIDSPALLQSDKDLLERIKLSLVGMMSYRDATEAEQTDILVRARQAFKAETEELPREAKEAPTYWRRVGCETIIQQCLAAIDTLEKFHSQSRKPKLAVALDPPTFKATEEGSYRTTLQITNKSIASATECKFILRVFLGNKTLYREEYFVGRVEANSMDNEINISIPISAIKGVHEGSVMLEINANYIEDEKKELLQCTFEIDRGIRFSAADIPWDDNKAATPRNFKGREDLLGRLEKCLSIAANRAKTYVLYGVTRSGKTSILNFLRERVHGKIVPNDEHNRRFFCINWDFNTAANVSADDYKDDQSSAASLWDMFLRVNVENALYSLPEDTPDTSSLIDSVSRVLPKPGMASGDKWQMFAESLKENGVYPVYLIDEFSYFKQLHEKNLLGSPFLSVMRQQAFDDKASFIIAGTYDILDLIKNPDYGITGQFANLQRIEVTSIARKSAVELIDIFDEYLKFTDEAKDYILDMTDCRPFLIQTICYNCANYAMDEERSILGTPEVRNVINILTGETESFSIYKMESGKFTNNLIFPSDKDAPIYSAITTILGLQSTKRDYLTYKELKAIWEDTHKLKSSDLARGLEALVERKVVEREKSEGEQRFRLKVGLFGLWWAHEHSDIEIEIDQMRQ